MWISIYFFFSIFRILLADAVASAASSGEKIAYLPFPQLQSGICYYKTWTANFPQASLIYEIMAFLCSSFQFVIGGGGNMSDFTCVENVAHANICAEQALCSNAASVAGKVRFYR